MSPQRSGVTLACVLLTPAMLAGCADDEPPRANQSSPSTQSSPTEPDQGAQPSTSGRLFSADVPWNADVSQSPVSERSDALIQTLSESGGWGTGGLQIDFSIPVFLADQDTPSRDVVGLPDYCYNGTDCDPVPARMPVPDGANIEGSSDLTCDVSGETEGQGDCHLLVVDREAGRLYETYQATTAGEDLTALGFFVWDLDRSYPPTLRGEQCTSADAAGFPIAALLPTADEVASGEVRHALRFILPNDRIKRGVYVAPATHAGSPESTDPDAPPYGVRLRLRSDVDESGFSDGERVILRALKTYGMLLSDGGVVPLTFADDRTSGATWSDLHIDAHSFDQVTVDQFEVVDLGEEIPLTYDCVRNP